MNSRERHEARYQRRVAKRAQHRKEKISCLGRYDDVFSYEKLYNSFYFCREGVRWKKSIQCYEATLLSQTLETFRMMKNRKFKPLGFLEFDLMERGKRRHIRAVTIKERCIQRTLCDHYLIPLIRPLLAYDNGASIKGKGTDFSINRMKAQLHHHFRKFGRQGYIFQYDFSSFFDNINHTVLLKLLFKTIPDPEIFQVTSQMITCFGKRGLGLGSQVSQICAIYYPTPIDRYFKEVLGIHGYGRYMDDGYAICTSLQQAKACKEALVDLCHQLDITINERKMRITRLDNTFIFLKKRFTLTETGKVIVKIDKSGVTRARRRLKKLAKQINTRNFNLHDFCQSYSSWLGMAKRYDNYKIVKSYEKLFHTLMAEFDRRKGNRDAKTNRIRKNKFYVQAQAKQRSPAFVPQFSASFA